MKKAIFILVALVLALSVGLVGCPTGEIPKPTSVKVGYIRDTNEPLSFFECNAAGPVVRWFVDYVNNTKGGVHLKDYDTDVAYKVPIELKFREMSVAGWDIATQTRTSIRTDKVHYIWGGPGTDTIYSQAPVCNAHAIPLITLEGGASKMIWARGSYLDVWPYVWVTLNFANWAQIPVLHAMLDAKVATPKAWVTYIGGAGAEHGLEYLTETQRVFGEANVIAHGPHAFELSPEDADAIIDEAVDQLGDPNNPKYHIACFYTYPWNTAKLIVEIITRGLDPADEPFNPPAIVFGPGGNFLSFGREYFYPWMHGMLCFAVSNNKTGIRQGTPTMTMQQMYGIIADQIEDDWENVAHCPQDAEGGIDEGEDQLDYWGHPCYVAALEMWLKTVETVGDVVATEWRDVTASYDATNPCRTVYGNTWYYVFGTKENPRTGGGIIAVECHTGQIGQWQLDEDGAIDIEIVGYDGIQNAQFTIVDYDTGAPWDDLVVRTSNYWVTADFIYPMTDLWLWLG